MKITDSYNIKNRYIYEGKTKYKIDKSTLNLFIRMDKKIPSVDVLVLDDGTVLIYGEDVSTGTQYLYNSSDEFKLDRGKEDRKKDEDIEEIDVDLDIDLDNISLNENSESLEIDSKGENECMVWLDELESSSLGIFGKSKIEDNENSEQAKLDIAIKKYEKDLEDISQSEEMYLEDTESIKVLINEDLLIGDISIDNNQGENQLTGINKNERMILRFSVEKMFLETLAIFNEGEFIVSSDIIQVISGQSKITFKNKLTYIDLEFLEKFELPDEPDVFAVDSFNNIVKALTLVEKDVYKHFILLEKNTLISYTDSIFMYSRIKSTVKSSYVFNDEIIPILKQTYKHKIVGVNQLNNSLLFSIGFLKIITANSRVDEIYNIAKDLDFNKVQPIFQVNSDFIQKIKLINRNSNDKTIKLQIGQNKVTIINSFITTSVDTKSAPAVDFSVDVTMLDVGITATDSKEPQVGILSLDAGSKVLVLTGKVRTLIKVL